MQIYASKCGPFSLACFCGPAEIAFKMDVSKFVSHLPQRKALGKLNPD